MTVGPGTPASLVSGQSLGWVALGSLGCQFAGEVDVRRAGSQQARLVGTGDIPPRTEFGCGQPGTALASHMRPESCLRPCRVARGATAEGMRGARDHTLHRSSALLGAGAWALLCGAAGSSPSRKDCEGPGNHMGKAVPQPVTDSCCAEGRVVATGRALTLPLFPPSDAGVRPASAPAGSRTEPAAAEWETVALITG